MSSSEAGDTPPSYVFVSGDSGHEGRSHAIRAHWRQRRQRAEMQRREREEHEQRPPRPLLPVPGGSSNEGEGSRMPSMRESPPRLPEDMDEDVDSPPGDNLGDPPSPSGEALLGMLEGIPAQALSGMNIALGSGRLDPFDRFPVRLTSKHHRLLHHWLSTFAEMMFNIHTSTFNPMRDVWLPLDLSNAASFNAIMAHSSAHLARMQGFPVPREAVQFKVEAVGIVQLWARDPALALSDDIIAGILRLLSFERYWGSEEEWQIHHNGLLQIIEARGGIATLQDNWRLEITTYLVTLMTRPSWFDSSNQLSEISQQQAMASHHPVLGHVDNLYKTRCVWLLSFMQDMRTFMDHSPEIYNHGLAHYTFIRDALLVVKSDLRTRDGGFQADDDDVDERERIRLACLFYICVMLQGSSVAHGHSESGAQADFHQNYSVASLNQGLASAHAQWQGSTHDLFECLFHGAMAAQTPPGKLRYALDITSVLGSMSPEARHGVEQCMLQILCQAAMGERTALNYEWTPDSLLACIQGH
ncbi:tachykinin family protein [Nemania sp. NC0429]|nr:tachykinin family protein [Nemania sp. NC0429]